MTLFRDEQIGDLRENLDIITERWDWKNILYGILEDVLSLSDLKTLNERLNDITRRSVG